MKPVTHLSKMFCESCNKDVPKKNFKRHQLSCINKKIKKRIKEIRNENVTNMFNDLVILMKESTLYHVMVLEEGVEEMKKIVPPMPWCHIILFNRNALKLWASTRPQNARILNQFAVNMEQMLDLLRLEINPLHGKNMLSWIIALSSEFAKDYWTRLQNFVNLERSKLMVFPPEAEVFTWMKHCPLDQIKVVIVGQDPYHKPRLAHGLCFSVKGPVPANSSLENILKEVETDVGFVNRGHGDLTKWAEQGVLLLNAVLTVRSGKPNSHKGEGWEEFTNRVVSLVSERNSGVVFLLWGNDAQQKIRCIGQGRHDILTSFHPSPLSAHRGFLGCGHFSTTNELLLGQWKTAIDWQI